MTPEDKELLKKVNELLWMQGIRHPTAAMVALQFTQFVERTCKDEKVIPASDGKG